MLICCHRKVSLYIHATSWHSTTELMQGDLAVSCKLLQHHNAKLSQIDAGPWPGIVIIDSTLGFSLIPTVPLPSLLTQEHEVRSFFETSQSTVEIHSLCILMQCYYLLLQSSLSLYGDYQMFGAKFALACELLIRHYRLSNASGLLCTDVHKVISL